MLTVLTFVVPLTQVPSAIAAAGQPAVNAFFPIHEYSNASDQHFYLMLDMAVPVSSSAIQIFGSAQNCVVDPFSRVGSIFDITVTGCSDGNLTLGLAANSIGDPVVGVGPAVDERSQTSHISRAIPSFGIGGWRETTPGTWEFHLIAPTGALRVDAAAFAFSEPTCTPSVYQMSATDYLVTVTGCPIGTPITVWFEPYSFFDWYANAGPASRVMSLPIVLTAAAVIPPVAPSPTSAPTLAPSPSASPSASLTPSTATLAQMLGLGDASPAPEVQVTAVPVVEAQPSLPVAAPETELTVVPTTQDEPLGSELTARDFAPANPESAQAPSVKLAPSLPAPNFAPVDLAIGDSNLSIKWLGAGVIALACVILLIGGWRFMKMATMRKTNARRLRVRVS